MEKYKAMAGSKGRAFELNIVGRFLNIVKSGKHEIKNQNPRDRGQG
jgi:hypothetical protein